MMNTTESSEEPPQQFELDSFLPYRLVIVSERVSESLARIYGQRFGIGNPEWRVIACIGDGGSMTSTEIGRRGRMHKTKVSRAVSELEGKGLLTRRVSQTDMRVAHLSLTPQGRRMFEQIVPLANAFADEIIAELSQEERAVFNRIIDTMLAKADGIATRLEAAKR